MGRRFHARSYRAATAAIVLTANGQRRGVDETYSPTQIKSTRYRIISGARDKSQISTSLVERSNLTWRTRCRRLPRCTNGHSKKCDNHEAALALIFTIYNFVTVHSTLKTTPAVAQRLTRHPWTMKQLLGELAKHARGAMERDPLPTEDQRRVLGHLLQDVLVFIRNVGGEESQALADAVHNIPVEFYGWGVWDVGHTRGRLLQCQAMHYQWPTDGPNFVAMFDAIFTQVSKN